MATVTKIAAPIYKLELGHDEAIILKTLLDCVAGNLDGARRCTNAISDALEALGVDSDIDSIEGTVHFND